MTAAEAAARIDAQKWREIADDLASACREVTDALPGQPPPGFFAAPGVLERYDEAVKEEEG